MSGKVMAWGALVVSAIRAILRRLYVRRGGGFATVDSVVFG